MFSKRLLLILVSFFVLGAVELKAQAPEQDCPNAIPVCQPIYQQSNSYVGTGSYPTELDANNEGCLASGEKNDVWYVINVSTSGTLEFTITPNNANDDYDFGVWDVTGVGCSAIYNYLTGTTQAYLPWGCNYNGTPGPTGLSNTIVGPLQWSPGLNVTAGQTLVLNVSNFSSTASGYKLDFTPSSASIYDTVKPRLTTVFTHCGFPTDTLIIKTSEPVKCNSITGTGSEWTITPAGSGVPTPVTAIGFNCGTSVNSATNTIYLILSGLLPPGNYNLNLANGTDNNTLLDNCGNAANDTSLQFTIISPDPQKMIAIDTPACISARIHLDKPVKCSTVAPDGSDFTITGPETVQILRATPAVCTGAGLTDVIDVFFAASIYTPGTYTIGLKTGNDGDVLQDTCGVTAQGTIDFVVSDQGYIEANASPSVLCAPGYANLTSLATIPPPPPTLSCGLNSTTCSTTPADYKVGTGTGAGGTTSTPLKASYPDVHTQMLFRAYELGSAGMKSGTISQLALNIINQNSSTSYDEFTIKIGCTSTSTLNDFEPGTAIVYGPVSFTPAVGVNTFVLDRTYDWDGRSNIVVDICYHNAFADFDDDVETTTGLLPGSTYQAKSNGLNGCALDKTNGTGVPAAPAARANITFTECRPAAGPQTYLWRPGSYLLDSTQQNTRGYAPKTSVWQVQILDSNYCYRRDTAGTIVSVRNPSIDHDTSICLGDAIQINAGGGVTYNWSPATGLSCTDCPSPFASPTTTTTYSASIADQYGCADVLDIRILVHDLPVVRITPHDSSVIYGQPLELFAQTIAGVRQYYWTPANGLNNTISANVIASPQTTTEYVVIVTDTNNCRGSDTSLVLVRTDVPVNIPTAFTPNGDGRNDFFGVFNLTFQRVMEFRVFNRWGEEVFATQDSHTAWDGTYKGQPQPTGVYQYLIRVAWPDGRTERYKGDVTLIR